MNSVDFQKRLASLMSMRKISGQAIADKVKQIYGNDIKISQRIVSSFKTGEKKASEEMQEKILRAISEISNVATDGQLSPQISLSCGLKGITRYLEEHPDVEIYDPDEHYLEEAIRNICMIFVQLPILYQEYLIENFEAISLITHKEFEALQSFARLNDMEKNAILNVLSEKRLLVSDMVNDSTRICELAMYMGMISRCITINADAIQLESDKEISEENEHVSMLKSKLSKITNYAIVDILEDNMIELLTMDATDWYILMQLKAYGLGDVGEVENKYTEKLGLREYGMYAMINELAEKSNERKH